MTLNLHEDTKMVLTLAAAKAEQLNHPVIDTEHILLILLNTQGDLFESYSLDIKQARFKLIRYLEQYETSPEFPVYEHGQTQRAFILICIAEMLAGLLQEENVLPDHLLAAISTETKSLAQQILSEGKIYTTRMLNELLLARQLPVTVDYFENFAIQVRNLLIFNLGICSTWQETERLLSVWNKILLNTELKSEFEDFHEVFLRQDMPEHAQRLHQTFSAILLHLELHISMTQAFQLCTENPQININEIVATVEELLTAATVNVRYSILKNKFSILQTHLAIELIQATRAQFNQLDQREVPTGYLSELDSYLHALRIGQMPEQSDASTINSISIKEEIDNVYRLSKIAQTQDHALLPQAADAIQTLLQHPRIRNSISDQLRLQIELGLNYQMQLVTTSDQLYGKQAIDIFQKIIDGPAVSPELEAIAAYNAGNVAALLYDISENEKHASSAESYFLQAEQFYTKEDWPSDWADIQQGRGNIVLNRYQRTTNLVWAENARVLFSQAADILWHYNKQNWALCQASLGKLASMQYEHEADVALAEEAEKAYHEVLNIWTQKTDPRNWALTQNHLGNVFATRYSFTYDEAYVQMSIEAYSRACLVWREKTSPANWAMVQQNLSAIFLRKHEIVGKLDDAQKAVVYAQNALNVYRQAEASVELANTHILLGNGLSAIFKITNDPQKANEAESVYLKALAKIDEIKNPVKWQIIQQNLGMLTERRANEWSQELAAKAAHYYNQSISSDAAQRSPVIKIQNWLNLGNVYLTWSIKQDPVQYKEAIRCYECALLTALEQPVSPSYIIQAVRSLTPLYTVSENWTRLTQLSQIAEPAVQQMLSLQLIREGKENWLKRIQEMASSWAYAWIKEGDLEEAAAVLERGQAYMLTEILQREFGWEKEIIEHHPHLWQEYEKAVSRVAAFERQNLISFASVKNDFAASATALEGIVDAHDCLKAAINNIRDAGYPEFLSVPTVSDLQAATAKTTLVYLAETYNHSIILIVTPTEINLIETPFSSWRQFLLQADENGHLIGGYLPGLMHNPAWLEVALTNMLPQLGETLLKPLAEKLRELEVSQITFIPTGIFGLFPLHSAPIADDTCLLDIVRITYAPSARIQTYVSLARQKAGRKLVAWGNPLPILESIPPIRFAALEVDYISSFFDLKEKIVRIEKEATMELLLAHLPHATHLHLACHGQFNVDSPLDSVLLVGPNKWTLREILVQPNLQGIHLVVLSACYTAVTDFQQMPNEAIGFPSALLQAGIPHIIGSLWSVNDKATGLLMSVFYEYLIKINSHPAEALRQAQLWLRSATLSQLLHHYKKMRANGVKGVRQEILDIQLRLIPELGVDYKPYNKPYYWAPFTYTGI